VYIARKEETERVVEAFDASIVEPIFSKKRFDKKKNIRMLS
jgi:hypothetical protein